MLEEKSGKPVVGVLPYLHVDIEEEDSLVRGSRSKPLKEELKNNATEAEKKAYKEKQFDILAESIRENLDMQFIYDLL